MSYDGMQNIAETEASATLKPLFCLLSAGNNSVDICFRRVLKDLRFSNWLQLLGCQSEDTKRKSSNVVPQLKRKMMQLFWIAGKMLI